jgi:putative transposase
MRRTYKFRLYPNKTTEQKLHWTLARCRELYNAALSERRDAYRYAGKSISYYDQQNDLPEIKAEIREEYQEIAAHVLQDVLRRLDKAFQNFFRRVKSGETPGYPRFQGRSRYDSFTYPDSAGWKLEGNRLHLSKIGTIKVVLHREMQGTIKTVTMKQEVDQWYVCFSCEVADAPKLLLSYEDVGVDLGVSHLATLSNGTMIEHPRYHRRAKKKLEAAHQAVSRGKKGSHRRSKAKKQLAKAYRKVCNQRRDFLHKESRKLVQQYQVIVFEDIRIGNLTKKPKPKQDENGKYLPNGAASKGGLNKSILDASWGMFVEVCSYKAASAGRTLIKVSPQFTSQICSTCGTVRKKDLSERWHSCECGTELDRDVNAAINILARGQTTLVGTQPTPLRV